VTPKRAPQDATGRHMGNRGLNAVRSLLDDYLRSDTRGIVPVLLIAAGISGLGLWPMTILL
jgi:hypothetical protein